ncbi:protein kinase [Actinomadura viridis]|uniref:serine/threonine-protein kinase n=1 Tax=Actinomadura viridis TaxID=58110 RepID=UPI0036CE634C
MSGDLVLNGRYRLRERLAIGGMGEVWRASDAADGREVAVKLLRPELMSDPAACSRFQGEAEFTAALRHDGIARVYGTGTHDGRTYLVMELIDGEPLAEIIARSGALPVATVLDLVAQSARALAAAHAAGIVHRDVKPGNLMVTRDGIVKITDFGIARRPAAASQTQTGVVMGTASYIAPERASGQSATPAADLYSLGVVAYECLSGHVPFKGATPAEVALQHVRSAPPALPESVPAPVRALVGDLLAKRPAERPVDAHEAADRALFLRDALGQAATGPAAPLRFDDERSPDTLTPGTGAARRRAAQDYASMATGTLLLGVVSVGTMWRGLGSAAQDVTRSLRSSTPRYSRASLSQKPTRKPPRATSTAPDPTPSPTDGTMTPSTPSPGPAPTESVRLGSEDKV